MGDANGVANWTTVGGDLSGAYDNLVLRKIQGKTVNMPSSISDNYVLKWNGSTWSPGADADTKPTESSMESGRELAWNGNNFETRSLVYLRGYISEQQTFNSGDFNIAAHSKRVKFVKYFSSDNSTSFNDDGSFTVPRTGYYFLSATVGVVTEPTAVVLSVFKSTDAGNSWSKEVTGNACPPRNPTTAVMVTGIVRVNQNDRLVVTVRNISGVDCKSTTAAPQEAQNILTVMELP